MVENILLLKKILTNLYQDVTIDKMLCYNLHYQFNDVKQT